jgi:hypothetical protein
MRARPIIRFAAVIALLLPLPVVARAQYENGYPDQTVDLAGPRFGFTLLSGGITDRLKSDRNINVSPLITQFGWQLERQFPTGTPDVSALTELVGLLGGLEQNVVIPSVTWVVGARLKSGFEFGVGPNITTLSTAIVYVAGVTNKVGNLNIPVNVAIVPSVNGVRATVLTGFNLRTFDSRPFRRPDIGTTPQPVRPPTVRRPLPGFPGANGLPPLVVTGRHDE